MYRIILVFHEGGWKYIERLHSRNLHRKCLRSRQVYRNDNNSELTSQIGDQITSCTVPDLEKVKTKIIYNSITHKFQSLSWKQNKLLTMKQAALIRKEKYMDMVKNVFPIAMKYVDGVSLENENFAEGVMLRTSVHNDTCSDTRMNYFDVDAEGERMECDKDGILTSSGPPVLEPKTNTLERKRRNDLAIIKGPIKSGLVCGGCGADIQCEGQYDPGFIPAEFLASLNINHLASLLCQRCYITRSLRIPLRVNFSAYHYLRGLKGLKNRRALVLVVVDVTDFYDNICSTVSDMIGKGHPVIIVANKVDLLPPDNSRFVDRIEKQLKKSFESNHDLNVKDVMLVSAESGVGMENLITKLFSSWKNYGDIYLVGYSNAGKSSVYNALLHSDLCKPNWSGQRPNATTAPWPGTTLGVLKFPIMRPGGSFLYHRSKRLHCEIMEKKLSKMDNSSNKQKIGFLASPEHFTASNVKDINCEMGASAVRCTVASTSSEIRHIRPDDSDVRWCHDTPGIVHSDRVLDLLTTDEMKYINPGTDVLIPRTFNMKIGHSLFAGGLARLDYVTGAKPIRITVFCPNKIPILVCLTADANEVYGALLGSVVLGIPRGGQERLQHWPTLLSKEVEVVGLSWKESCADFVISSAGWMAITPGKGMVCSFSVHTPGGLGIGVRTPSILPYSVCQRGPRRKGSPAYPPINPKRFTRLL